MDFSEFLKKYKWTVLCVIAGILLTILLLTIGFWKTLLLLIVVALCFAIGYILDRGEWTSVKTYFRNLFHKDHEV